MERVQSLINKLSEQYAAGQPANELLVTLEQMRRELASSLPVADHTKAPISVLLPQGYQSPREQNGHVVTMEVEKNNVGAVEPSIQDLPSPLAQVVDMNATIPADKVNGSNGVLLAEEEQPIARPLMVPRPPAFATMEVEEEQPQEPIEVNEPDIAPLPVEPLELEPVQEETILVPELTASEAPIAEVIPPAQEVLPEEAEIEPPLITPLKAALNTEIELIDEKDITAEKPIMLELKLEDDEPAPSLSKGFTEFDEAFLHGTVFVQPAVRPKELHEILATRVVANKVESQTPVKSKSETIALPKITDLRKGIAINDRFRYIASLFRGDEAMFERAIKTINNFGVLQEAQYWMQRELVIKLGWNDEDELVQQFFQLVSRRFA